MNKITLTGIISSVKTEEYNNQIWFSICNNERYIDKDGNKKSVPSFFNVRIQNTKFDIEKYKVGKLITISGVPKTYNDKNNVPRFYVVAFKINEVVKETKDEMNSYDTDGTMLWNGKRCESKEATPEQIKEMEDMLSEFK